MKRVKLSRGKHALISDEDHERVSKHKWHANPCHFGNGKDRPMEKYYARNWEVGYMHRFIMEAPKGFVVDHLDGNGLNNQRSNLRLTSQSENTIHCRFRSWKAKAASEPFL